jgi:hypothetical protein
MTNEATQMGIADDLARCLEQAELIKCHLNQLNDGLSSEPAEAENPAESPTRMDVVVRSLVARLAAIDCGVTRAMTTLGFVIVDISPKCGPPTRTR